MYMRTFSIFTIPTKLSDPERHKRRHMLARLGIAWLIMMQVMTLAFPGYLRSESMGADNLLLLDHAIVLMNWLSFALTVPVITYCAWPVWQGALSGMRQGNISMDVPVAVGITVAFVPSVVSTLMQQGQVYFESVSMFVAFLLTARYLELCARQSVAGSTSKSIEQIRTTLTAHADKVALWFVIAQLGLAIIVGAIWFAYIPEKALAVTVALIVISCPCAMAMAVPTAVAAAHASVSSNPNTEGFKADQIAKATVRVSKQNLYGSVIWHLIVTPMAAIGWVAPWLAAITMLLSSLAVAANSIRMYRGFRNSSGRVDRGVAQGAKA